MPRPTSLDVVAHASHETEYELESARSSTYTINKPTTVDPPTSHSPSQPTTATPSFTPSIRLLFSLISFRQRLCLLLPAITSSAIAGGVAPFMTLVIGQVFDAFARFPMASPDASARDKLLHDVGFGALELLGLGVGSLALSSITSSLWIWAGEYNVFALRMKVYRAVTSKEMAWFDMKIGAESEQQPADEGTVGAGGLMATFTRETDDVRAASSLASGMLIQYLTTCITCLVLAFIRSWALTLVILSALPLLILIQAFSQVLAGPLLGVERRHVGIAATLVERAVTAIATVKAFNAENFEHSGLVSALASIQVPDQKLNAVWGFTSGLSQFVMMAMFVQGFWFGAKLVRDGHIAPGDVMSVFWACLIATSNLQMCIPQFVVLAKGKFAMASLLSLAESHSTSSDGQSPARNPAALRRPNPAPIRKIIPSRCIGELALHDVTFSYPSRPSVKVLDDVSLYLPAGETTFIVGGSGSGKSTIAQLLLRMYTPQSGHVQLDDQDLQYLDEAWTCTHLAGVSQECVLFDRSVHDNVALAVAGSNGRVPADVSRDEVIEACTAALIHDFIKDLPDGYDTKLGNNGTTLSGGQKQRLAIARARVRNPPVLILDEATSALDPTSRILVFEAIKRWRANKTTIVITHDLSQICASDFVYVLQSGHVVEQGFRYDLEAAQGEFNRMMTSQGLTGGFLPTKDILAPQSDAAVPMLDQDVEQDNEGGLLQALALSPASHLQRSSRRVTFGNWMFDVVADLTSPDTPEPSDSSLPLSEPTEVERPRRPSSAFISVTPPTPPAAKLASDRPRSLQFSPTSPNFPLEPLSPDEKDHFMVPLSPSRKRVKQDRARWDEKYPTTEKSLPFESSQPAIPSPSQTPYKKILADLYPLIPHKPLLCLGLLVCLASGAMTPVFSFLLSRLLYEVSTGAHNFSIINMFGGIVLSVAAFDGFVLGLKYFIMETSGMHWVSCLRRTAFGRILSQDKKWFDDPSHSPVRIVQVLIKDGDDVRNMISVVLGQSLVVVTMLSVGLIWALVRGWQLTLVGLAIGPVFAATMAIQSKLIAQCEVRNKRIREQVAKSYYETILNVRSIRYLSLHDVFLQEFELNADSALTTGVKGAFVEGCTYGVASGLIYLAEALLFYVGAVLVSRGSYSYIQMVEVLNLVVFTVTISSQLMVFTQKIAKGLQATRDFYEFLKLDTDTDESQGSGRVLIEGDISFNHVDFSYPQRPEVKILKDFDLQISQGELIALVGTSGSGKSTVVSLLQRMYEPNNGDISFGTNQLQATSVQHLRQHISVVSQSPHLFDASISSNIRYGDNSISEIDVRRAAKAANVHEFIMSLPQGYDTHVGENASLISGGQAQRLQIARALARPSNVLILDECTSALDPTNQNAILEAISRSRAGRIVIMITHKIQVMRACDRIVLLDQGHVIEQGAYDELVDQKGMFASLANGGEWTD